MLLLEVSDNVTFSSLYGGFYYEEFTGVASIEILCVQYVSIPP